jgi:hypothetical protein
MNDRATEPQPNIPGEAVKAGCLGVSMSLLKEAIGNQMAYLKAGFYGIAGSGKTFTASLIAVGLSQLLKSDKPIAMADTETGSDFVRPRIFDPAGKKLFVAKTKAFSDLLNIVDEAEKECDVLIIDSISHFHDELMDSFLKKNQLTRMRLKDWQPIKATWREFTSRFVQSKLHVIICGRSGDVWEEKTDPEDGAVELKKVGTKMRAEREISYEPSLLVEMEAVFETNRVGSNMIRRAFVKKDRFDVIDGKFFDNPTLDAFMPHICLLNLGGEHKALETGRDSQDMFDRSDIGELKSVKRDIALEKITSLMLDLYPGQSEIDKTGKRTLMKEIFGTNSWTEVSRLFSLEKLDEGIKNLEILVLQAHAPKAAEPAPAPVATPEPTNGKPKTKGARA